MLKVDARTIPHKFQRYDTAGDWYGHDRHVIILMSELGDSSLEALLFIHEFVEAFLCMKRGISDESVTQFDKSFIGNGEPGDDPNAPYHREHLVATAIETALAEELGIDMDKYDKALYKLGENNG